MVRDLYEAFGQGHIPTVLGAVVVEGRYTGACKATGKSLDAQYCHVFKIRDGKLASFQQFVDTAQWQAVMGTR